MNYSEKYVQRDQYLSFLRNWKDKHIIKVVSGVRRSGKSTLFALYKDFLLEDGISEDQIISINFEDFSYFHLTEPAKLHEHVLGKLLEDKMNYVFLDEVQHVRDFERVVDSLFIRENIDLYITGSNAYFLSGELATLLSGRFIELKMLPLSFAEFVAWHGQNDKSDSENQLFDSYLKTSFPFALFLEDDHERIDYLQGIYSTVILNDIVKRLSIQDVRVLERLLETLFSSIGSLVTVNKLKNTLVSMNTPTTNATIDRYIKGILDSMIMYEAKRYDIHGRALLDTQEKYYAVDTGLRRLLLPDHKEDMGHILENIVFLELKRRGNKVYVGKTNKYEVDFVAVNPAQEISYYQVALTVMDEKVLERELRALQTIRDQYPKVLLTMDEIPRKANYEGISKVHLIDWLLGRE